MQRSIILHVHNVITDIYPAAILKLRNSAILLYAKHLVMEHVFKLWEVPSSKKFVLKTNLLAALLKITLATCKKQWRHIVRILVSPLNAVLGIYVPS